MAATFTSITSEVNQSSGSMSFTAPSGSGGMLMIVIVEDGADKDTTLPSGWTNVAIEDASEADNEFVSHEGSYWCFIRDSDGGANDSPTVTTSSGNTVRGYMMRIANTSVSDIENTSVEGRDNGAPLAAPSADGTADGIAICFWGASWNPSLPFSVDNSFTLRASQTDNPLIGIATKELTSTGAVGDTSLSVTSGFARGGCVMVTFQGSAGGGGGPSLNWNGMTSYNWNGTADLNINGVS